MRRALAVLKEDHSRIPDSGQIAHLLARLLATSPDLTQRDGAQALSLARAVVGASPSSVHWETLALAALEVGDCKEAATAFSAAQTAAGNEGQPAEKVQRLGAAAARARSGTLCSTLRRYLRWKLRSISSFLKRRMIGRPWGQNKGDELAHSRSKRWAIFSGVRRMLILTAALQALVAAKWSMMASNRSPGGRLGPCRPARSPYVQWVHA